MLKNHFIILAFIITIAINNSKAFVEIAYEPPSGGGSGPFDMWVTVENEINYDLSQLSIPADYDGVWNLRLLNSSVTNSSSLEQVGDLYALSISGLNIFEYDTLVLPSSLKNLELMSPTMVNNLNFLRGLELDSLLSQENIDSLTGICEVSFLGLINNPITDFTPLLDLETLSTLYLQGMILTNENMDTVNQLKENGVDVITRDVTIPEPATVLLFGLGGLALIKRRKA